MFASNICTKELPSKKLTYYIQTFPIHTHDVQGGPKTRTVFWKFAHFKWNACKKWTTSPNLVVIFSAVSLHWNCAKNIDI